jgi:hypothetical protein
MGNRSQWSIAKSICNWYAFSGFPYLCIYHIWETILTLHHNIIILPGVPSLKRSELETACEDFSNIIGSTSSCMLYKGTLSSGVEIAVASSLVTSAKDWSKENESQYRKKVAFYS